jgi:hypothetical protein
MVKDIEDNNTITNTNSKTNFHELCNDVAKLDSRIAGALIIRNSKLLATSIGAGAPLPINKYLTKLLLHAQIMSGIPLANEPVFGGFNFTLISHEKLENILFHLQKRNVILVVGILPPYDRNILLEKIRNFLIQIDD